MPQTYYNQTQFNSGQLSTKLRKRSDLTQYQNGVQTCTNFIPEVHGPLTKRPGTKYVNEVTATGVRLVPFIYSGTSAYVLEFTNLQMRVYKDGALLGAPFTLTTTITTAMLPDFQYAQNGDTMYIVHPNLAPQELIRLGDTNWVIHSLGFIPEPTYEAGSSYANDTTLAATSGTSVNWTADTGTPFRASDVNRFMVEVNGPGIAVVTGFTSTSVLVLDILTTYSTTDLNSGEWRILGSPFADVWINKVGPPGTIVSIDLYEDIDDTSNSNLITNGDFSSGLTGWDDRSRPLISSGTCTSGANDTNIIDSSGTFITDGVQENYIATNTTRGEQEYVSAIVSNALLLGETNKANWASGDNYQIRQSGSIMVDGNSKLVLNGERNGIGWAEQDVTSLTANRIYALKFRVEDSPLSMQVGTSSLASDLVEEKTYDIGEHKVYYSNSATTNYIQFRNNQYTNASLVDVEMKLVSVGGFRGSSDVGKYVRTAGGLIEITSVDASDTRAAGIIRAELVAAEDLTDVEIVAGNWALESAAWSSTLGYPRVITLHDQRLVFGSTATFPTRLWGSVIGDFINFNRGESNDDDSYIITVTANEVNQFQWLLSEHNLMAGTGRDEIIISAGLEGTITPTNRKIDVPSRWGSISHRPLRVGDAVIFIERNATSIREMLTNVDGSQSRDMEMTLLADGIAAAGGGIKTIAFQQRPRPTIWAVLNDGTVMSGSYLKEQEVMGWVLHDFSHDVHDLTVIPAGVVDQVWIAVNRLSGKFQMEYMEESDGLFGQLVTDGTVIYDSTATSTITGLAHLEGLAVSLVLDGEEHPDLTVSGGQITGIIPDVTYAEVGLPIASTVTFLRPDNPTRPSTGFTINAIKVALSLHQSKGGEINGTSVYTDSDYRYGVTSGLYSGTLPAHGIVSDDGDIPAITVTHSDVGPFQLQAITYLIEASSL